MTTAPAAHDPSLDAALAVVESRLAALGDALRARDNAAIDAHAGDLHRALAQAIDRFANAARASGGLPPALRDRLANAGARVAAQRESLARATAALDRAMEILLPQATRPRGAALYDAHGGADRAVTSSGSLAA